MNTDSKIALSLIFSCLIVGSVLLAPAYGTRDGYIMNLLLESMHDVSIIAPSANDCLRYDAINLTWNNTSTCGGASSNISELDDIPDVDTTGVISGKVLKYNGTFWIDDIDLTGTSITHLNNLTDVVILSPANNQILTYNGTHWKNISSAVLSALTMNGDISMNNNNVLDFATLTRSGTEATTGAIRLLNGDFITWRNSGNTNNNRISFSADDFDVGMNSVTQYSFSSADADFTNNDLANVNDFILNDQDATPISDRELRVIDGEIKSASTSDVEGRYISKDSLELITNNELDPAVISGQTALLATPSEDYVLVYDNSANVLRKTLINNLGIAPNTCSSAGLGQSIVVSSSCSLRGIKGSGDISVTTSVNDIVIDYNATIPICSNLGATYSQIYKETTNCDFREIKGSSDISITQDTNTVTVDFNGTGTESILLCSDTISVADTSTGCTLSTSKRYLHLMAIVQTQSNTYTMGIQLNGDTGTNYASRKSANGGADTTTTNQGNALLSSAFATGSIIIINCDIYNISSIEKVGECHLTQSINVDTTAPTREEATFMWDNSANAITSVLLLRNAGSGTFTATGGLVVYGHD